jgi:hypothetical protein
VRPPRIRRGTEWKGRSRAERMLIGDQGCFMSGGAAC